MITLKYHAPQPAAPAAFSTEPRGCGWFESSYELARGTEVNDKMSIEEFELWVHVAHQQFAARPAIKALAMKNG